MSPALRLALCASAALHLGAAAALHGPGRVPPGAPALVASLRAAPLPLSAMPAPSAGPAREEAQTARPATKPRPVPEVPPRPAAASPSPAARPGAPALPAAAGEPSPLPAAARDARAVLQAAPAQEPPRFDAAYLANPPPAYPASARRRGIEGTAVVEARISPAGEPREIRLAASAADDALDAAALEAVRGWRFEPARRGSQAVEAWVRIPVVFRLN